MRRLRWSAASLAAALSVFAACSYSPQLKSGELKCSAQRECPRGYSCSATNVCCADGDASCGAGTGSGGSVGHVAADFIGTWTFGSTAMVESDCDDNTVGSNMLDGTMLTITKGATGGTALTADWSVWRGYGCPALSLSYDATGAHLVDTSWFCESDTATLSDFWVVSSFDVTTNSPTTATHYGYYGLEETKNGNTVTCLQTVTATLTKTKN